MRQQPVGDIGFPFILILIFEHYPIFQYFIESLFKVDDLPGTVVLMLPTGILDWRNIKFSCILLLL